MQITDYQLSLFALIIEKFKGSTAYPEMDRWRSWTDNDIWIKIVTQIAEVGNSLPGVKLEQNKLLHRKIAYERLTQIQDRADVEGLLAEVIAETGVRFKNKALDAYLHNLDFLVSHYTRPSNYVEHIVALPEDADKVAQLARDLKYFSHKSARDFAIALGIVQHVIAFDSRLGNVFKSIGLATPKGYNSNARKYKSVEKALIEEVCIPAGIHSN